MKLAKTATAAPPQDNESREIPNDLNPLGHRIRLHEGLISHRLVDELANFHGTQPAISSFYVNLDPQAIGDPVLAARLAAKNAMRQYREQLEKLDAPGETKHALMRDWDIVFESAQLVASDRQTKGLACFVSSADQYGLALRFPTSIRNRAFFDSSFVVWPLEQLLDQADHYVVCLTDKDEARIYHYYLNEIELLQEIHDVIPGKVRIPDAFHEEHYQGKHLRHTHYHYVNVAAALLKIFERRNYQRLIVGGLHEELPTFEEHLHRYVHDRIVARWDDVEPNTPYEKLIRLTVEQEQEMLRREAEQIWQDTQEVRPERRAIGMDEVCRALWMRVVGKMLIDPSLRGSGARCQTCGRLQSQSGPCVECGNPTAEMPSLQEEAVHDAVEQSARVRYWKDQVLKDAGSLAALNRY